MNYCAQLRVLIVKANHLLYLLNRTLDSFVRREGVAHLRLRTRIVHVTIVVLTLGISAETVPFRDSNR